MRTHCKSCDTQLTNENTYKNHNTVCKVCFREDQRLNRNPKSNPDRRRLNGKYAKRKEHPALYEYFPAGSYTLSKEGHYIKLKDSDTDINERSKKGFIYVLVNPAWPNWVKIGQTDTPDKRLKQFWTATPHRDHEFVYLKETNDMDKAERQAHTIAESKTKRKNEWFKLTVEQAIEVLDNLDEHRPRATKEANTDTPKDKLQERPIQADLWSYAEDRETKRVS
jgi:hypothetical protein